MLGFGGQLGAEVLRRGRGGEGKLAGKIWKRKKREIVNGREGIRQKERKREEMITKKKNKGGEKKQGR